jgi:hypothetical protein
MLRGRLGLRSGLLFESPGGFLVGLETRTGNYSGRRKDHYIVGTKYIEIITVAIILTCAPRSASTAQFENAWTSYK